MNKIIMSLSLLWLSSPKIKIKHILLLGGGLNELNIVINHLTYRDNSQKGRGWSGGSQRRIPGPGAWLSGLTLPIGVVPKRVQVEAEAAREEDGVLGYDCQGWPQAGQPHLTPRYTYNTYCNILNSSLKGQSNEISTCSLTCYLQ